MYSFFFYYPEMEAATSSEILVSSFLSAQYCMPEDGNLKMLLQNTYEY
jgi:hypothetical protein